MRAFIGRSANRDHAETILSLYNSFITVSRWQAPLAGASVKKLT